MKNLYYCTKKNVYLITKNDDGTQLTFFPEEKNAGAIIVQRGGIQGFLAHCIEDERTYDEFSKDVQLIKQKQREYRAEMHHQNELAEKKAVTDAYSQLLAKYGMTINNIDKSIEIDATRDNLYILMRYLRVYPMRTQLPRLSQGYTVNTYGCDGKIAVTITLSQGLLTDDLKIVKKLQYGAPMGHLTNYTNIGRL